MLKILLLCFFIAFSNSTFSQQKNNHSHEISLGYGLTRPFSSNFDSPNTFKGSSVKTNYTYGFYTKKLSQKLVLNIKGNFGINYYNLHKNIYSDTQFLGTKTVYGTIAMYDPVTGKITYPSYAKKLRPTKQNGVAIEIGPQFDFEFKKIYISLKPSITYTQLNERSTTFNADENIGEAPFYIFQNKLDTVENKIKGFQFMPSIRISYLPKNIGMWAEIGLNRGLKRINKIEYYETVSFFAGTKIFIEEPIYYDFLFLTFGASLRL